jgi:hypothetical protein
MGARHSKAYLVTRAVVRWVVWLTVFWGLMLLADRVLPSLMP